MIWFNNVMPTVDAANSMANNTLIELLDIQIEAFGDDFVTGSMPVDARTHQPYGLLHGGASVVLAESLGSLGAAMCVDHSNKRVVGLDINANHLRSVREGRVVATASPIHLGKTTHVWAIEQRDGQDRLTCVSRLTMAVLNIGGAS